MLGLAQYAGHESILLQGFGQGRNIGLDLGKAKCPAIMGIPTSHPDRPGGHTNRNRDMPMLEAQPLTGKLIDVRSCSLDLGTINPNGVTVHVVQGNEHDIEF